jgi:dehydrogenase/reductase SDR family member 12
VTQVAVYCCHTGIFIDPSSSSPLIPCLFSFLFLLTAIQYQRTGYVRHVKKYTSPVQPSAALRVGDEGADGITMEGKVVVITGANSGVGKELATYAAAKGAKVYMICRSPDRAEQAKQDIVNATNATNTQVQIVVADTGVLADVRAAVKRVQEQESHVDCLVCNAGALLNSRTETNEGWEVTFASHLLGGSYLLSQLLLPQLKAATNPRVIFVTSGGMLTTKFPDWKTATSCTMENNAEQPKYSGELAYAYAKRGQVLLAERLTETIPEIQWVSAHPGWTATAAVDSAFGDNKKYLEPMRSTWEGAEGIAWLMGAPKDQIESAAFYLDRTPQSKHVAGPFFTEGSFTKNTKEEVDEMMSQLKQVAGV